jgi:hypothetical protein
MDPNQPTPEQAAPRQETGQSVPAVEDKKTVEASQDAKDVVADVKPRIPVETPKEGIFNRIINWRKRGSAPVAPVSEAMSKTMRETAQQVTYKDGNGETKGVTKVVQKDDGSYGSVPVNGLGMDMGDSPSKAGYWNRINEAGKSTGGTKVMETPHGYAQMDVNGVGLPTDNQPLPEPAPTPDSPYWKAVQEAAKPATTKTEIGPDGKPRTVTLNGVGIETTATLPTMEQPKPQVVNGFTENPTAQTPINSSPDVVGSAGDNATLARQMQQENEVKPAFDLNDSDKRTKPDGSLAPAEKVKIDPIVVPQQEAATPVAIKTEVKQERKAKTVTLDGLGVATTWESPVGEAAVDNPGVKPPAFDLNDSDYRTGPDGTTLAPAKRVEIHTVAPKQPEAAAPTAEANTAVTPGQEKAAKKPVARRRASTGNNGAEASSANSNSDKSGEQQIPRDKLEDMANRIKTGDDVNNWLLAEKALRYDQQGPREAGAEYKPPEDQIGDLAKSLKTGDDVQDWLLAEKILRYDHQEATKQAGAKPTAEGTTSSGSSAPENRPPGRGSDVVRVDSPQGQAIEASLAGKVPEMANSFTQNPLAEQTTLQSKDTTVVGAMEENATSTSSNEAKLATESEKQTAELRKQVAELSKQVADLTKQLAEYQAKIGKPEDLAKLLIEAGVPAEKLKKDGKELTWAEIIREILGEAVLGVIKKTPELGKNVLKSSLQGAASPT